MYRALKLPRFFNIFLSLSSYNDLPLKESERKPKINHDPYFNYNERFPILDIDEDFFLRKQMVRDAEAFFEYYTNPEVARYIFASNPRNLAEATSEIHYYRDLFKYKHDIYWILARKEDDST